MTQKAPSLAGMMSPQADAHAQQLLAEMQKLAAARGMKLTGRLRHATYIDEDAPGSPRRCCTCIDVEFDGRRETIAVDSSGKFSRGDDPVILEHDVNGQNAVEDAFFHVTEKHLWPTHRAR